MNDRATLLQPLPMTMSPEGLDFIKGWESCQLRPYLDGGGVWTCGWGHTGPDVTPHEMWTQDHADSVLAQDVRRTTTVLRGYIHRTASQQQFDALSSLAFNCGAAAIGNSGLMSRFNSGLDKECADRFLQWNHDNGVIVPGLTRRREAERMMYLIGEYSGRP
jgi:lysozyme